MSRGDRKFAPLFSVWQIDAWSDGEDMWTWNDKFRLFEFRTDALNLKRAFVARLRKYMRGISSPYRGYYDLGRGWYYLYDDFGYCIELRKRCNDEPVYAAIRETPL